MQIDSCLLFIKTILSNDAVIVMLGALIGGFCTFLTSKIEFNRSIQKQNKSDVAAFYYMILVKVNMLQQLYNSIKEEPFVVFVSCLYTKEDSIFLYERLNSVYSAIGDSDTREIAAFLSDIQQLEIARQECTTYIERGERVASKDEEEYKRILRHCYVKLENNSNLRGILYILDELEKYIGIE